VKEVCRLSIIVPLLGDPLAFEDTLVSVLQNRPPGCEVLVVHPGRYEDPYHLSDEVVFVQVDATADVLAVINAGMLAAHGEILHLLQPGVSAEEGWTDAAVRRFRSPEIAAVAPMVLSARDRSQIVAAGLRYTAGGRRVVHGAGMRLNSARRILSDAIAGPALVAAFYRRSIVLALEGFCPQAGPWHADIDLALSMRRLGFYCELEPESIVTTFKQDLDAPLNLETGRSAERVFRRHRRQLAGALSLPAHAAEILSSVLMRPHQATAYTHLAGRLLAVFEQSGHRDFGRRLQRAGEACRTADGSTHDDEEDGIPAAAWPSHSRRMVA
jgi:hypothetical protein